MKKKHLSLKVLLSIGAYTWSASFPSATATAEGRKRFAQSAVRTMGDWGFDGIDVNWEYPENEV